MAGSAKDATLAYVMADREAVIAERDALRAERDRLFAEHRTAMDLLRENTETLQQITAKRDTLAAANEQLRVALEFYADPNTYFAIAWLPDPPCGVFVNDFSEIEELDGREAHRPGKRARAALAGQPATPAEPVNAGLLKAAKSLLPFYEQAIAWGKERGTFGMANADALLLTARYAIAAAEQAPAPSVNGELVEAVRYARRMLRMTTHPHHDAYDAEYLDKLIAKYAPGDGS